MGGKSSSKTSSTTNITTTTQNVNAVAAEGSTSVAADSITGDIGLTGFDAVQAIESFNKLQRDRDLLIAQRETNILRTLGKGAAAINTSSSPVYQSKQAAITDGVSSGSFTSGAGSAKTPTNGTDTATAKANQAVLLLGGAAAVATILALRK